MKRRYQCDDCKVLFGAERYIYLHRVLHTCGNDPSIGGYLYQDGEVWRRRYSTR